MTTRDEIQRHTDKLLEKLWESDVELRESIVEVFNEKMEEIIKKRVAHVWELDHKQEEKALHEKVKISGNLMKNWQELIYTLSDAMAFKFADRFELMRASCLATFSSSLKIINATKRENALRAASERTEFKILLDDSLSMVDVKSKEKLDQCRNMLTLYDSIILNELDTDEVDILKRRGEKEEAFSEMYEDHQESNKQMIKRLRETDFDNIGFKCENLDAFFK